jgi:hypothetical protein
LIATDHAVIALDNRVEIGVGREDLQDPLMSKVALVANRTGG